MRQYTSGTTVVRSCGIEMTEEVHPVHGAFWAIQFVHVGCLRAGQSDVTRCTEQFLNRSQYEALWLQKHCGCAVTLSAADRQSLEQYWAVRTRLAQSHKSWPDSLGFME